MTTTYTIDPAHSGAQFVVRHMMITNVRGAFSNIQGKIAWDAANPSQSTIEAVIDASTIHTHEAARDAHLKSATFWTLKNTPRSRSRARASNPRARANSRSPAI
jgi:polyisoprenoid-binding protein YceI